MPPRVTTAIQTVKEIRTGRFFLDVLGGGHHLRVVLKDHLTPPDVAKLCGVDQKSIWNWCRAGTGPRHTMTPGGHMLFRPASVARWMAENDFRVPAELRQHLSAEARAKEELLVAVEDMPHADRVALLVEYNRWLAAREA